MLEVKDKIYIKKRTFSQWLTLFVIVMPFFLQALLQFFGFPGLVKYTLDLAWVLLLCSFFTKRWVKVRKSLLPFTALIIGFFCYCLIVHLFNFDSPFYFLWGFRNNFRFYIAFFAFAMFIEKDDIEGIFKFIDILFYINLFVSVYQIVVLGYVQDFCGGIFGVETGSNASTIILFAVVTSRSMLLYMNGKEKAIVCLLKCAIALFVAAFAELKFFFVIFIMIAVIATLLTKFSWKKMLFIIVAVFLIGFSSSLLTLIFESDISFDSIMHFVTAEHYSSAKDLGRFTAIPRISETILTEWWSKLFGLGLGNCDTSSFAVCNTPFFQTHQSLNYIWFSSACLFLETGYIGLVLFISFFVVCLVKSYNQIKNNNGDVLYSQMAIIMAVLCILLTFYNSSLRTEIGYVAYFILAIPFIYSYNDKCLF